MPKAGVDMGGWYGMVADLRAIEQRIPRVMTLALSEVANKMLAEVNTELTSRLGPGHSQPTQYTGRYSQGVKARYGHTADAAWVTITSTVEYADAVEVGSGPLSGALPTQGSRRQAVDRFGGQRKLAEERFTGPLADAIYAWDRAKMHRGTAFANGTIKKLINEGTTARYLIRDSIGPGSPNGIRFRDELATTTRERLAWLISTLGKQ